MFHSVLSIHNVFEKSDLNINKFLGISIMGKNPRLSLVTQRICTSVEKDITTCT
jgi:hypothetical protein